MAQTVNTSVFRKISWSRTLLCKLMAIAKHAAVLQINDYASKAEVNRQEPENTATVNRARDAQK